MSAPIINDDGYDRGARLFDERAKIGGRFDGRRRDGRFYGLALSAMLPGEESECRDPKGDCGPGPPAASAASPRLVGGQTGSSFVE